ncbi:hypothetical protein BCR42DRAFT_402873 [Absidia repens]|uniref:Uncharacterized protein n=1 Tax=Absidia repens TaxID=90262 RepID=A0A1X2J0A0_9FUNG|nr:hypothetical protein BCR42DRAFT_402873 [Absidia repens]
MAPQKLSILINLIPAILFSSSGITLMLINSYRIQSLLNFFFLYVLPLTILFIFSSTHANPVIKYCLEYRHT